MSVLPKIKDFVWNRKFLINIGLILLFYILLSLILRGCLSYRTNFGQKIEVPNLIGKNQNNLANILEASDLKFEVLDSIYDPTKIEGTIIEQNPNPTSKTKIYVKEGRTIKVRVTKRTQLVEVPNLISKSQRFAEGILRNREFRCRIEYVPSREAHGAVLDQYYGKKKVSPGTKLPIGSTIRLRVGRNEIGSAQNLPNLVGMSIDEARMVVMGMMNTDIMITCQDCATKADSAMARIQVQSPEFTEGAQILSGGTITVQASKNFSTNQE